MSYNTEVRGRQPHSLPGKALHRKGFTCVGAVCILALGALAIEVFLLKLLHDQAITPAWAAAAHFAVVTALGFWTFFSVNSQGDLRLPLLLTITTALLGPIGAFGTLLTVCLGMLCSRSSTPFEEWYSSLFPEEESKFASYLFELVTSSYKDMIEQTGVTPFIDVLSFGTQQQKQAVITLITEHFQPAFAPALCLALNDRNNAIRVQAATAITKIENNFLARDLELSNAVKESPGEPDVLWALARHYDDCAYTGIQDSKREQDNRLKALEAYRNFLGLKPQDFAARLAIGRILFRNGQFLEAADWLDQSIRQGFATPQILLWHMDSLFHLGRYQELRELAKTHYSQFSGNDKFPAQAIEAVKLWAGKGDHQDSAEIAGAL